MMDSIKGHLCLVSDQPTPNLTPLLDKTLCPERVVLLVSKGMEQRADWLEAVLRPRGLKVTRWSVGDPWDIEALQNTIMELLESDHGDSLALNATGGTKPMSIAAFSVFTAYDKPVFYVHPDKDRILWLHPHDLDSQPIEDRIKLGSFFLAHGFKMEEGLNNAVEPALREVTLEIVNGIERFQKSLGTMNWLASKAEGSLISPVIDPRDRNDYMQDLIDIFEAKGLCFLQDDKITFSSEESRFFINGGWLEDHVYSILRKLSAKNDVKEIQDLRRGVEVQSVTGGSHNELDVAFLADNRFYMVECKTRNWRDGTGGAEAIYKLDTLKETLGGLKGEAMLVTYREMRKADLERAGNEGIEVCQYVQLRRLDEHLRKWIRGSRNRSG